MGLFSKRPRPRRDDAPDAVALAALGAQVTARLAADPTAWRVPIEGADIFAFADFLDAKECARFITLVDRIAEPSQTFDIGRRYRTSYSGNMDHADPFVRMIDRRIDDLLGIDPSFGETVQGQRYHIGQEYEPHFDWFDPRADYWEEQQIHGGQRAWTAMIYLNEVEEGGETEFTELGFSVTPQRGSLLVWNNAAPDGKPHMRTKHAARPVLRGVKYVATKWYRSRPWI
jgi:prolyl 4-hydroxylase